ncbi:hypothetical protein BH24ACT21_BH24ACT21_01740 [soil metagenome]
MDFKEQELDFQEADRRYAELKQQRDTGSISNDEFDTQFQQLMVLDDDGRWWAKSRETGEWRYHNGNTWVPGTPPGYEEDVPETNTETSSSPAQATTSPSSKSGRQKRKGLPLWIPIVGIGGLALIGLVLFFWVLVPSLLGGESSNEPSSEQAQNGQGGSAQGGVVFDAIFTHRSNPDNISDNSTFIDNPSTNGNPDAVLQVTQNWNPEGSGGTYNNHPVGVWYNGDRNKWAIFNQDRAAMPEGSAFNVSVLEEAPQE